MEPETEQNNKTGAFGTSMECPHCKSIKSKVVDKRNASDHIIRRRQCENGHRYNTLELDANKPGVTKKGSIDTTVPGFQDKLKNAVMQSIDYSKLAQALFIK